MSFGKRTSMSEYIQEQIILILSNHDNVGTALRECKTGDQIDQQDMSIRVKQKIRFAHKVAIKDITAGDSIIKYGEEIGIANQDIESGEWVHVHNCDSNRGSGDLEAET
jgi:altronate dehydratase small subunit